MKTHALKKSKKTTSYHVITFVRLTVFSVLLGCFASLLPFAYASINSDSDEVITNLDSILKSVGSPSSTTSETTLGDVASDAVRLTLGTDIAVLNGGDFAGNLWGDVTWSRLLDVFPENRKLSVALVTPSMLADILEQAVSHVTLTAEGYIDTELSEHDGFPQISGFTMKYDASANPGERVVAVTLDSGKVLDLEDTSTTLTLAATSYMLDGGFSYSPIESMDQDQTLVSALAAYIPSYDDSGYTDGTNRITAIGAGENRLVNTVPNWILIAIAPLLILVSFLRVKSTLPEDGA